jgi:anion-transporting  ArsA/GET3 family ATPase
MAGQPQNPLEARRFIFVTGKGGVGKTTVCAALALALAARNKRVLVAMCGAHERLSAILGTPPIGHDIQAIADRVWASKIQPELALEEYGQLVIKVKAITRAVFGNQHTRGFFRAMPGLFEWAMLGKAWWHATEVLDDGSPRFDTVLFDAPSTGHGLDMLRVPKVILDIVPPGVLRRDAERAWEMFRDPERCGVVVVSLPEEMAATETIELVSALQTELALPIQRLIINGVLTPKFSESERGALLADPALLDIARLGRASDAGERSLAFAARRAAREQRHVQSVERLERELDLPTIVLPYLHDGAGTPEGARDLAGRL